MIRDDKELRDFYRILHVLKKHVDKENLIEIKQDIRIYQQERMKNT